MAPLVQFTRSHYVGEVERDDDTIEVWRDEDGHLRVWVRRDPDVDAVRRAALALIERIDSDGEYLILQVPKAQLWDPEFGRTWSRTLEPVRRSFACTAIVGSHNAVARMAISTIAMLDRQTVKFFETVEEAKRRAPSRARAA